jgi:hypothetical protein
MLKGAKEDYPLLKKDEEDFKRVEGSCCPFYAPFFSLRRIENNKRSLVRVGKRHTIGRAFLSF